MTIQPGFKSPLISVIIATRDAELTIRRTLQSVVHQSMKNFEIILIDGASTDGTLSVVDEYQEYISHQLSESDTGIAEAWNKGLHYAKGQWITFLNAGDLLHRDHFARAELAFNNASETRLAVLYCDVIKFNYQNECGLMITGESPNFYSILRGSVGFAHPGSFSSSACFKAVGGFDERLSIAIDTDWILRVYKAEYSFKKFASVAYMAEGGISDRKFYKGIKEYFSSATRLGILNVHYAKIAGVIFPALRKLLHIYRILFRSSLRSIKHASIALINIFGQFLLTHSLRHVYFRVLGFALAPRVSIGWNFQFYRLGNIKIGEGSVINRSCLFDNRGSIEIGRDVSISRDVKVFTAGHDIESPFFEMITQAVKIEDYAVIFSNVMIMPGVTIGRGAVVYSGSVVTNNVDPMSIVGGVPARLIKKRNTPPFYRLNYPYPLAM